MAMRASIAAALLLLTLILPSTTAQTCLSDTTFSQNRLYAACTTFSHLGAALHWTYYPSNGTVDAAYRAPSDSTGWVGWALNPTGSGMIGAQALIAFTNSSSAVSVFAVPISSYKPNVADSNLSYRVYSKEAEYSNGAYTIYARFNLPGNKTRVNQVWQAGTQFSSSGAPVGHSTNGENILTQGSVDFVSGVSTSSSGDKSRLHRRNTHGILNALSWGVLMPIGVIIARYMKVFKSADPAWFYLHVGCQCSAYILGVAGWGLGMKLGSDSVGITYHKHRAIGITLFCLATLQVLALLMRPNKDHKYRNFWDVYHRSTGYTVISMSIVNIFKGFDILLPNKNWKNAYIGVIATLGGIALILEAITWVIVLKRRSRSSEKSQVGANGTNGTNSYGGVRHQAV